jgi:hypothetical protein
MQMLARNAGKVSTIVPSCTSFGPTDTNFDRIMVDPIRLLALAPSIVVVGGGERRQETGECICFILD